jgi:hypothetical protein
VVDACEILIAVWSRETPAAERRATLRVAQRRGYPSRSGGRLGPQSAAFVWRLKGSSRPCRTRVIRNHPNFDPWSYF